MQFMFDGEVYKIIRITGPMHNMLGLSLVQNNLAITHVKMVPLQTKKGEANNINALEVKEQVLSAVAEINAKFGTNYKVEKIQFVPSDTPVVNIYKELAIELINRVIAKGAFVRV